MFAVNFLIETFHKNIQNYILLIYLHNDLNSFKERLLAKKKSIHKFSSHKIMEVKYGPSNIMAFSTPIFGAGEIFFFHSTQQKNHIDIRYKQTTKSLHVVIYILNR